MTKIKNDILNCLNDLKGGGKYAIIQSTDFVFPGLVVEGLGEIAFPINDIQAAALKRVAHKGPYGKGSETIVDKNVRSGWQIDADKLSFTGNLWNRYISKIINNIKPGLGLEEHSISAHLYKLLIYEEGDFFLPHQDSEKEKGMFGSLVIGLPSKYSGGELIIRFEKDETVADFASSSSQFQMNYAAFYADCEHEVKPVTSGYRVNLVYNLVQEKSGKKIEPASLESHVQKLASLFNSQEQSAAQLPYIILLGHQYTPDNFSIDTLKLNDRFKAEALLLSARRAGYYAKMCLVTSYKSGMPADSYGYDYGEGADEDAEMEEVYDESLNIEHWEEGDIPALYNVKFEEGDLIASFVLDEDEPILKEAEGYMGNYGPDLMHWYHYGAVIIWSHKTNAQLLAQQDTETKLAWIEYFINHPKEITNGESAAVEMILASGFEENRWSKKINYNIVTTWLISRKEREFFLKIDDNLLQFYFTRIAPLQWVKILEFTEPEIANSIINRVTTNINLPILTQLLAIIRLLLSEKIEKQLVTTQIKNIPVYFSTLLTSTSNKDFPPTTEVLQDLFEIEKTLPQNDEWTKNISELVTADRSRKFINYVLAPVLLNLSGFTSFSKKILSTCREYLQAKSNNPPQPPANWKREIPESKSKQWKLLEGFLASPTERIFEYRKNQSERSALEAAIKSENVDLKTETIKKGSPHILRITKTQDSYHQKRKEWEEDVVLLGKIIAK